MECGLLGRKLGHSYSPQIHACLGDYSYTLFEKEPEEVADFLKNGDFTGLNVTIPYKKTVIPYLDELSPAAEKLGAVNTVVRRGDGTLFGHNTDYFGFASLLNRSGLDVAGKKVLVLGSGGASNTVTAVLTGLGAEAVVISRSGASSLTELAHMGKAALLVPYPFAADDHQAHNARVFAAHGAARMMRENTLTPDDIAAFLNEVLKDSSLLASMNECALRLDMPDAVSRIANVIEHTDHAASHD